MRVGVLNKLCCPSCKRKLVLKSFIEEENDSSEGGAGRSTPSDCTKSPNEENGGVIVKEGVLLCSACMSWYPIFAYVPVMLVFETRFHKYFAAKHDKQLQTISDYRSPRGVPKADERSVQETFTEEWDRVQGNELSFLYSLEDLKGLNSKVWLKWLGSSDSKVRTVLNIGCGLGRESQALQAVTNADVFAVDLNFGLLKAGETFKSNKKIHLIIASLFHLPFESSSFDLVYCQGVIHFSCSTEEAFKSITSYVRRDGFAFVWVFGLDDHLLRKGFAGFLTRINYSLEKGIRPMLSAAPKLMRDAFFATTALILHPLIKSRVRHQASWKLGNTEHDLRNMLSPRYSHRHSYNEVFEWFETLGFRIIDVQSPAAYRQLFQKQLWGVGVTGQKCDGERTSIAL